MQRCPLETAELVSAAIAMANLVSRYACLLLQHNVIQACYNSLRFASRCSFCARTAFLDAFYASKESFSTTLVVIAQECNKHLRIYLMFVCCLLLLVSSNSKRRRLPQRRGRSSKSRAEHFKTRLCSRQLTRPLPCNTCVVYSQREDLGVGCGLR
jgi:hypothetical protein